MGDSNIGVFLLNKFSLSSKALNPTERLSSWIDVRDERASSKIELRPLFLSIFPPCFSISFTISFTNFRSSNNFIYLFFQSSKREA